VCSYRRYNAAMLDQTQWQQIISKLRTDTSIRRIGIACDILHIQPDEYRNIFYGISNEIVRNGIGGSDFITLVSDAIDADWTHVHATYVLIKLADPWLENGYSPFQLALSVFNELSNQCLSKGMTMGQSDRDAIWIWLGGHIAPAK
jgi:hypothetical protein